MVKFQGGSLEDFCDIDEDSTTTNLRGAMYMDDWKQKGHPL
jgi:hypothetical protein